MYHINGHTSPPVGLLLMWALQSLVQPAPNEVCSHHKSWWGLLPRGTIPVWARCSHSNCEYNNPLSNVQQFTNWTEQQQAASSGLHCPLYHCLLQCWSLFDHPMERRAKGPTVHYVTNGTLGVVALEVTILELPQSGSRLAHVQHEETDSRTGHSGKGWNPFGQMHGEQTDWVLMQWQVRQPLSYRMPWTVCL